MRPRRLRILPVTWQPAINFGIMRVAPAPISARLLSKPHSSCSPTARLSVVVRQSYRLLVETFGDRLLGYLDDALLFSLNDAGSAAGQIGLYCWRNTGAHFEALQVESLEYDPVLWQPGFTGSDA